MRGDGRGQGDISPGQERLEMAGESAGGRGEDPCSPPSAQHSDSTSSAQERANKSALPRDCNMAARQVTGKKGDCSFAYHRNGKPFSRVPRKLSREQPAAKLGHHHARSVLRVRRSRLSL